MVLFFLYGHRRNPATAVIPRPLQARTRIPSELAVLFPFLSVEFWLCICRSPSDRPCLPWHRAQARAASTAQPQRRARQDAVTNMDLSISRSTPSSRSSLRSLASQGELLATRPLTRG
jgi:hypothetical protein